jgi:hypothetical protein
MKHHRTFVPVVLLAALAVSSQVVAARDRMTVDAVVPVAADSQSSQKSRLTDDVPTQPQVLLPAQTAPATIFREIPSISGRLSVGGRTIMPYLGAGFGGGYTSELNRSLTGPSPAQPDVGLRSQFGQGFSPNEFQMGLRIPF